MTELDQKTSASAADGSEAPLIASPVGTTTAGDIQAFGSIRSAGADPDHNIQPTDLQAHDPDAGPLPTPADSGNAGAADAHPAIDHAAVAATFQEGVTNGAGGSG